MSWNREGQTIQALYLGEYPVVGTVEESRVKYGGTVQHRVAVTSETTIQGIVRDILLIDEAEII